MRTFAKDSKRTQETTSLKDTAPARSRFGPSNLVNYQPLDSEPDTILPSHVDKAIGATGQPLGPETRPLMEQRFGHDFSKVRIYSDSEAANSTATLNARAYTLGSNIVFGAGEYAPQTRSGKSLLAHELAHVAQQGGTPAAIRGRLSMSNPAESHEQSADAVARAVMNTSMPSGSAALRIREQLRMTALSSPVIQRAVKTWGGDFDTDKYESTKDPGMDGVEIELRFKPSTNVNAELIGMTQSVRPSEKGTPFAIGSGKDKTTLESRMIPAGEAGAGTGIDVLPAYGNPLYAAAKPGAKDTLADTSTVASWGQHGWRYTDKAGKLQTKDAFLKDRPQLLSSRKESKQIFETTALAVKGDQTGTFYGSVQWGWEKDAADKVTKLPLSLVSQGVPSATFGRASELWNKAKTSEGKETIDLPVVSVKVIAGANEELFANPDDAQGSSMIPGTPLPVGTRFRVLRDAQYVVVHPVIYIEIVDGPLTGQRGYILTTVASRNER